MNRFKIVSNREKFGRYLDSKGEPHDDYRMVPNPGRLPEHCMEFYPGQYTPLTPGTVDNILKLNNFKLDLDYAREEKEQHENNNKQIIIFVVFVFVFIILCVVVWFQHYKIALFVLVILSLIRSYGQKTKKFELQAKNGYYIALNRYDMQRSTTIHNIRQMYIQVAHGMYEPSTIEIKLDELFSEDEASLIEKLKIP
jgi:hypothetical protein